MPKSKGRKKAKRRPPPPPRPDPIKAKGPSPVWYVVVMGSFLSIGLLVIVVNYIGLLPGGTHSGFLMGGLASIAGGFGMMLNYR